MGKPTRRRLTADEMRLVLAIERDLNDRRGLHLSGLGAKLRREMRDGWKSLVAEHLPDVEELRAKHRAARNALAFVSLSARSVHAAAQTAFNTSMGWDIRVDECAECGVLDEVKKCRDDANDEEAYFCERCREQYSLVPLAEAEEPTP